MNCQQINNIPFRELLEKLGFIPVKENNRELWYLSLFREEKTASFKVSASNNTFYDFGEGIGGTIVDFWCRLHNCNVKTAIEEVSRLFSFPKQVYNTQQSSPMTKAPKKPKKTQIKILDIKPITHLKLIEYLNNRCLSERVYPYIREVTFELKGNRNFAIGFMNDKDGYELRNSLFKGCTNKAITTLIKEESKILCVFEGWSDYLSYLERTIASEHEVVLDWYKDINESYLILNSLSMKKQAIPYLNQFEQVRLYLDNDDAGRKLSAEFTSLFFHAKDCSDSYSQFKDYNEYYIFEKRKYNKAMDDIRNMIL